MRTPGVLPWILAPFARRITKRKSRDCAKPMGPRVPPTRLTQSLFGDSGNREPLHPVKTKPMTPLARTRTMLESLAGERQWGSAGQPESSDILMSGYPHAAGSHRIILIRRVTGGSSRESGVSVAAGRDPPSRQNCRWARQVLPASRDTPLPAGNRVGHTQLVLGTGSCGGGDHSQEQMGFNPSAPIECNSIRRVMKGKDAS